MSDRTEDLAALAWGATERLNRAESRQVAEAVEKAGYVHPDDHRAEVKRLTSPERDTTGLTYGDKVAWRELLARTERAEAERDALRATVARVEALAEHYEAEAERHHNAETVTIDDGARAYRAAQRADEVARSITAALADPERDEEGS